MLATAPSCQQPVDNLFFLVIGSVVSARCSVAPLTRIFAQEIAMTWVYLLNIRVETISVATLARVRDACMQVGENLAELGISRVVSGERQ